MQTFIPYPNFKKSAQVLDNKRLNKQKIEVIQILNTLLGNSKGWENHPAVRMWAGHETQLCHYGFEIIEECLNRRFNDTQERVLNKLFNSIGIKTITDPPWMGHPRLHASHRAALLAKYPEHYSQFGWKEKPYINYFWPTKEGAM